MVKLTEWIKCVTLFCSTGPMSSVVHVRFDSLFIGLEPKWQKRENDFVFLVFLFFDQT